MVQEIKPIKRSSQLAPLSREHHDDLLFAWKIRQGIKYDVAPKIIASYCYWFWENHLQDHFFKEETAFSKILNSEHPMMVKMLEDHVAINSIVQQLAAFPTIASLERLASVISFHVRYEERTLFNYIEEVASPGELEFIYATINRKKTSHEWSEAFWLKK
jgi:hypothetical protein